MTWLEYTHTETLLCSPTPDLLKCKTQEPSPLLAAWKSNLGSQQWHLAVESLTNSYQQKCFTMVTHIAMKFLAVYQEKPDKAFLRKRCFFFPGRWKEISIW